MPPGVLLGGGNQPGYKQILHAEHEARDEPVAAVCEDEAVIGAPSPSR
jgi:hypothetical protein